MASDWELLRGFSVALFAGLMIGLEREKGKLQQASGGDASLSPEAERWMRNPAGIRTHTIVALLGALAQVTDQVVAGRAWFTLGGLVAVAIASVATYALRAARTGRYGMTSVFTLLTTYVLGVLSLTSMAAVAAAIAVTVAATLAVKTPLHNFVRNLTGAELAAGIKFGLIAIVLLPLLPNQDYGPTHWPWLATQLRTLGVSEAWLESLNVFNPYRIWFLVVAISAVGLVGYILTRALGPERGLPVTGMVAGIVSSTAVTLSMAQHSQRSPEVGRELASAVLAACSVMAARVAVIVVAVGPPVFPHVAPAMALMCLSAALIAWRLAKQSSGARADSVQPMQLVTPFALRPAIKLSLLVFFVGLLARVLTQWLGSAGLLAIALLSGIADVDAITAAVGTDVQRTPATVTAELAATAIFLAVCANTVVKAGMALVIGSKPFGRTVAIWLIVTLIAGAAGLLLSHLW